jgi:acetoin utilization deacetylase AcuC-like enzyme
VRTGFSWHELFAWHDAGTYPLPYVEPAAVADSADAKRRFRNLIDVSGLLAQLQPLLVREATDAEILRAHAPELLEKIVATSRAGGGSIGRYAHIGAGGERTVRLAAGAAIEAVDAVLSGEVLNAYALLRPCGHHATRDASMGFCIVNNLAIAACHALDTRELARIAVVDWDVHHGNGTQSIFWDDPRVLTISLHQDGLFALPGGQSDETGPDPRHTTNLNVPLPAGSGHDAYLSAFERVVLPALDRFAPQLILVASGLDASSHDALGRMNLHSDSYRAMTMQLMDAADRHCDGRLVLCHEGGYSATLVPFIGLAIVETLAGVRTQVVDPFLANVARQSSQKLFAHQAEAIGRAQQHVAKVATP